MRTDQNLARRSFRFSDEWRRADSGQQLTPDIDRRLSGGQLEDGRYVVHSLSGNERNHLFVNRQGSSFDDLSMLSGLDNPADGRGFALLDYDHDGWQDIVLVNANEPLLNLYHNQMGGVTGHEKRQMIAVRFVGGNHSASAASGRFACRDGYGALVTANLGDTQIQREHRCGEGFGTQNSATMILGIGSHDEVPQLTVRWPSGKTATIENVAAGTLLIAYEDPSQSPDGNAFAQRPYHDVIPANVAAKKTGPRFPISATASPADIRVYTTMATWCVACKTNMPQLRVLQAELAGASVDFIGVPIDHEDDESKLVAYTEQWKPPYQILTTLDSSVRQSVTDFLTQQTESEPALPSTIITDAQGNVLEVMAGVPSVSQVRKLMTGSKE